jgi:glycosyltransferase involved in cell wall biosynthesis
MEKRICIISLSKISNDGRVLRQIEYLSKTYELIVIGFGPCPDKYISQKNIEWREIKLPKNLIFRTTSTISSRLIQIPFFPGTHRATKLALRTHCDAFLANNWDSLPSAAIASKKFHSKLILDIHESYDAWYWGINKRIIQNIFNNNSTKVHASTTVVNALAHQHKKFGFDPIIVRNIPNFNSEITNIKKTDPNKLYLVSHGPVSQARRTDLLIQSLALSDKRYELHLIITNHRSAYAKKLRKLAEAIAPNRVFFHQPVSPTDIVKEISKYDIGFYPLYPTNYNNLIALPNKFFEFIAAGLAVCIGPSPSMAEIIEQYNCGLIVPSFDPELFAETLNNTTANKWDELKMASLQARNDLNADVEMRKLINIFKELLE